MRALIHHLPDFSDTPPAPAIAAAPARARPERTAGPNLAATSAPETARPPAADMAAIMAAAVAEARIEARIEAEAAARVDFERQRRLDLESAEQRLAELRGDWAAQEGDRLAAALADGLRRLHEELAAQLAGCLRPLLAKAVREQALSEMEAILRALVSAGETPLLRVAGPPDLIGALQARLDPAIPVAFEPRAAAEVTLVAGGTTFESRITAWLDRLDAALDD